MADFKARARELAEAAVQVDGAARTLVLTVPGCERMALDCDAGRRQALIYRLAAFAEAAMAEAARPEAPEGGRIVSRRWEPGSAGFKGHSAGADCTGCGKACEPSGLLSGHWFCPRCKAMVPCCKSRFGLKGCELVEGHEGDHESASGTSWRTQERPEAPEGAPVTCAGRHPDGWACTLAAGHPGWHQHAGDKVACWPQEASASPVLVELEGPAAPQGETPEAAYQRGRREALAEVEATIRSEVEAAEQRRDDAFKEAGRHSEAATRLGMLRDRLKGQG